RDATASLAAHALSLHDALPILLCVLAVTAQNDSPGYYTKAEALFKQKKYYEAIQYYEKYLATEIKTTPRSQPFAIKKKAPGKSRSEEHTSELQSRENLVCRLLL